MDHTPTPARKNSTASGLNMEIVIAILVSLLAVGAILGSRKFPHTGLSTDIGSARFPLIYACALLLLCGVLVLQNLRKGQQDPPVPAELPVDPNAEIPSHRRAITGMAATAACLAAMPFLGYALTTGLYLSFLMGLLGKRDKVWNPLLALAITAAMYFLFSAGLHVPLPVGSLFE